MILRMSVDHETVDFRRFWSEGEAGVFAERVRSHGEASLHDHVCHELAYIESGTVEHLCASGPRMLRPGDLIILRPQIWHGYLRPRQLTLINCLFDRRLIHRFWSVLSAVEGAFELFRQPARYPETEAPVILHVPSAQRPELLARVHRMTSEQHDRANGWQAAMAASLLDVLIFTARLSRHALSVDPIRLTTHTDQAVLDVVTHLEMAFRDPPHLSELAKKVHVSPAYLSRTFKHRMGLRMVEFIHRLRCEEACRLLRWTDHPIWQIATSVGYDEIAYFSRQFRKQMGRSPREYRDSVHYSR